MVFISEETYTADSHELGSLLKEHYQYKTQYFPHEMSIDDWIAREIDVMKKSEIDHTHEERAIELLIFLAGHGDESYFICKEGSQTFRLEWGTLARSEAAEFGRSYDGDAGSDDSGRSIFKHLRPCDSIFICADSCHSGRMLTQLKTSPVDVLFMCSNAKPGMSLKMPSQYKKRGRSSILIRFLIDALQPFMDGTLQNMYSTFRPNDEAVKIWDVFRNVYYRMAKESYRQQCAQQHVPMFGRWDKASGQIFCTPNSSEMPPRRDTVDKVCGEYKFRRKAEGNYAEKYEFDQVWFDRLIRNWTRKYKMLASSDQFNGGDKWHMKLEALHRAICGRWYHDMLDILAAI